MGATGLEEDAGCNLKERREIVWLFLGWYKVVVSIIVLLERVLFTFFGVMCYCYLGVVILRTGLQAQLC